MKEQNRAYLSHPKILQLPPRFILAILQFEEETLREIQHRHLILPTPNSEVRVVSKRGYSRFVNTWLQREELQRPEEIGIMVLAPCPPTAAPKTMYKHNVDRVVVSRMVDHLQAEGIFIRRIAFANHPRGAIRRTCGFQIEQTRVLEARYGCRCGCGQRTRQRQRTSSRVTNGRPAMVGLVSAISLFLAEGELLIELQVALTAVSLECAEAD